MSDPVATLSGATNNASKLTLPDGGADLFAEVCARPNDNLLLRRCMEKAAPGDPHAGLEWALAMQAGYSLPIWSVMEALAASEGEDAPRQRFAMLLEQAATTEMAPIGRAWEALLRGHPVDEADATAVAADTKFLIQSFFRLVLPRPKLIPLMRGRAADLAVMEADGIRVEPLRSFIAEFLTSEPAWQSVMVAAPMPSEGGRERVIRSEADTGWVGRTLASGLLTMLDPLTGEPCHANDGLIAFGRCLYRFEGQEPFFLLTGGPWNAPQGVYLPRRNLILHFDGEWRGVLNNVPFSNILTAYLRRRVVAAPPQPEPPPGFTLYLPPIDNFAHQLWNFQTGVERIIRLGHLPQVRAVRFSGTEFFGSLTELFPELDTVRMERPRREQIVDPAPCDPSRLVLPAGGFFLPRSLTDRVIGLMRRKSRSVPDAIEPADVPRAPGAPVIWLALRVRGRAWIGQEEGFGYIIRHIMARRPDATFLLDGFSFPLGDDGSSEQWAGAISTLNQMAQRIAAAASDGARIVNMIGNSMRESVLWATETDAYLAPYGSTQHKVAWFTEAPGIVYAPPAFSPSQVLRSPGFAAAEISALPRLIIGEEVVEQQREVGPARQAKRSTANVRLDPAHMAEALWEMLEPRFPPLGPSSAAS